MIREINDILRPNTFSILCAKRDVIPAQKCSTAHTIPNNTNGRATSLKYGWINHAISNEDAPISDA